jgi:hypothetical protein
MHVKTWFLLDGDPQVAVSWLAGDRRRSVRWLAVRVGVRANARFTS